MWGKDVTEITGEQIMNTLLTCKKLKPAHLLKVTLLRECFFTIFKLYKWYQIAQRI